MVWTRVAYLDPLTRHENACMRAATYDPAHFLLQDVTLENMQSRESESWVIVSDSQ